MNKFLSNVVYFVKQLFNTDCLSAGASEKQDSTIAVEVAVFCRYKNEVETHMTLMNKNLVMLDPSFIVIETEPPMYGVERACTCAQCVKKGSLASKLQKAKEYLGEKWIHHPKYHYTPRHSNNIGIWFDLGVLQDKHVAMSAREDRMNNPAHLRHKQVAELFNGELYASLN